MDDGDLSMQVYLSDAVKARSGDNVLLVSLTTRYAHLRTSAPPHLCTSALRAPTTCSAYTRYAHLRTSAPPHLCTSALHAPALASPSNLSEDWEPRAVLVRLRSGIAERVEVNLCIVPSGSSAVCAEYYLQSLVADAGDACVFTLQPHSSESIVQVAVMHHSGFRKPAAGGLYQLVCQVQIAGGRIVQVRSQDFMVVTQRKRSHPEPEAGAGVPELDAAGLEAQALAQGWEPYVAPEVGPGSEVGPGWYRLRKTSWRKTNGQPRHDDSYRYGHSGPVWYSLRKVEEYIAHQGQQPSQVSPNPNPRPNLNPHSSLTVSPNPNPRPNLNPHSSLTVTLIQPDHRPNQATVLTPVLRPAEGLDRERELQPTELTPVLRPDEQLDLERQLQQLNAGELLVLRGSPDANGGVSSLTQSLTEAQIPP